MSPRSMTQAIWPHFTEYKSRIKVAQLDKLLNSVTLPSSAYLAYVPCSHCWWWIYIYILITYYPRTKLLSWIFFCHSKHKKEISKNKNYIYSRMYFIFLIQQLQSSCTVCLNMYAIINALSMSQIYFCKSLIPEQDIYVNWKC